MLALACGLFAMLLFAGTASAAAPTVDPSSPFACSVATPCGSFTSWNPTYVSVSQRSGDVYVIDSANDAVEVFDANGNYVTHIPGSAIPVTNTFGFGGADEIAVDNSGGPTDGDIYVASEGAGHLFAFDSSGNFLWSSDSGVNDLCGVAVDGSGNPWIGDFSAGAEKLNAADGTLAGTTIANSGVCSIAFDSSGNIAMLHLGAGVDVMDQSGNLLHTDNSGNGNTDVAVETVTNSVYSLDANGVTIWDASGNVVAGTPFGPHNSGNSVDVNPANGKIYITEPGQGRVDIYDLQLFTVGVTANGTGSGRVDADTGQISGCTSAGGTCSDSYITGSTVTLVAAPDSGSSFTAWTGCDNPSGNTCTVSVTSARAVTATFDLVPTHVLRVAASGSGSGTIASTDSRISCGATCQATYQQGDLVALTARAAPGSTFTGWSGGGCNGTSSCQVTMNADTNVTATFVESPTVSTGGASGFTQSTATVSGTVNPNGAATTCTFEFGTSTSYGSSVPCASAPGSGASGVSATAGLSGLAAGTTYHYRIVATNAGGTSNGGDATFTTASTPPPPTCQTDASLCPRPRPGVLHLAKASVVASGSKLVVQLSCVGGTTCRGTLKATAKVKVTTGKGRSRRTRTVTLVVAQGSVRLAAGRSGKVTLTLTRSGRQLLARTHQLSTTLAGVGLRHTLVIRSPAKAKKHH